MEVVFPISVKTGGSLLGSLLQNQEQMVKCGMGKVYLGEQIMIKVFNN